MKLRPLWLTVYGVVVLSLLLMMNALITMLQGSAYSKRLVLEGIDVNDMSSYYVMGEYYPPENIDTLNVVWQGGRVEIIAYNDDQYFVEEAATRQLNDSERLSYSLEGNVFSVYFTADDTVKIDDAYKKVEIRVPNSIAKNLKSVNVASNGEVVIRNISADDITVNGTEGNIRCGNTNAKNMILHSVSGNVELAVKEDSGFAVEYNTKSGRFKSDVEYTEQGNNYIYKDGGNMYSVTTESGKLYIKKFED